MQVVAWSFSVYWVLWNYWMAQKCLGPPGLAYPLPDNSLLSFLLPVDCFHYHSVRRGSLALALQLSLVTRSRMQ